MPIAKRTVYLNADRTEVRDEGADGATFLLARAGAYVSEADAKQWGLETDADAAAYDAAADHAAKHGGETAEQARRARERMLEGQPDPDGEVVEGERGDVKASPGPRQNKALAPDEQKAGDEGPPAPSVPRRGRSS